jgi:aldehyde dehydrogenase (NAD+)
MRQHLKFYIGGEWVDPTTPDVLDVINPATEQPFARISVGSSADVDRAVAAARAAFNGYSRWSVEQRTDLLNNIIKVYKKRYDDMAEAISLEMGAPMKLARSWQARLGLAHFKSAVRTLSKFEFETVSGDTVLRHEPIGVCGLITPWNWPINQIAVKVAPALAVGCTMILKPSEVAPIDAMVLAEILDEAGVPKGVFNLVNGYGMTVGEAMSAHPGIDMMSFTGSTRGGIAVAKAAAGTVKRVGQELGGKSPNIILPDTNIAKAVADGVDYCMDNSGQSCNAPTRMLVPRERMDVAIDAAREAANRTRVGDPASENTDIGPVVSDVQYGKIQRLIQAGIDEGATLVAGGPGRPENLQKGYYVKPTVFANVTNDMTIAREEIFGPVICILGYDDEEQAIEIANDTDYGLAGYVCSDDLDHARSVAARIRAGQVSINYNSGDADTPFGGYKQSGNGREKGVWGLMEFLEVKAITGTVGG